MNEFSDHELDKLIRETVERQVIMEEISASVMHNIRRQALKATVRKWARLVAFALGLPLLFLISAFGLHFAYKHIECQPIAITVVVLPIITLIAFAFYEVQNYSIDEFE